MTALGLALLASPVALGLYSYVGYPLALRLLGRIRGREPWAAPDEAGEEREWPSVSITVPAYNEAGQIADTVESLLALDYPPDRRQILIVSDASDDGTDDIVRSYADRGVELLRMPTRGGKTAAETAATRRLRGDIVINTDASIRIEPAGLKRLVRHFRDPDVGLASGRDVSVSGVEEDLNEGEGGYVGYEMRIRDLETRVGGIVGASGCFYAIRRTLHDTPLPEELSRDFAAALNTTEQGYRAISVNDARCRVPRTPSIKKEYFRKVRTMTRGMETLWYKRALLNPFRHPLFAWKLFSHKVCRWILPVAGLLGLVGLGLLAPTYPVAGWLLVAALAGLLLAVGLWAISDRVSLPGPLRLYTFAVMANLAAVHALLRAIRGEEDPTWEPTRRHADRRPAHSGAPSRGASGRPEVGRPPPPGSRGAEP